MVSTFKNLPSTTDLNEILAWWMDEMRRTADTWDSASELAEEMNILQESAVADIQTTATKLISELIENLTSREFYVIYHGDHQYAGFPRQERLLAENVAKVLAERNPNDDIWVDTVYGETVLEFDGKREDDDVEPEEFDIPDDGA